MKLLFWDVETSTMELVYQSYELRTRLKYHPIDHIKRDWIMLGAAWKYEDEKPKCISVSPQDPLNDFEVIKTLHGVLSDADILCGHNSDAFDYKKFNARSIFYDLPPIMPKQTIDTLKIARKYFKFSSNQLRYIANYLGLDAKDSSPDWDKCLAGDKAALRYMRQYNKQDVIVTEQVYKKLRPFMENHPNMNLYRPIYDTAGNPVDACPKCGSTDLVRQGFKFTTAGKRQKYQCKACFGWTTEKRVSSTANLR